MKVKGFWGLQLGVYDTYKQVVTTPFRITMAALDENASYEDFPCCLVIEVNQKRFAHLTLNPDTTPHQLMDLTLHKGQEVNFLSLSLNPIYLTGNFLVSNHTSEDELEEKDDVKEEKTEDNGKNGDEENRAERTIKDRKHSVETTEESLASKKTKSNESDGGDITDLKEEDECEEKHVQSTMKGKKRPAEDPEEKPISKKTKLNKGGGSGANARKKKAKAKKAAVKQKTG